MDKGITKSFKSETIAPAPSFSKIRITLASPDKIKSGFDKIKITIAAEILLGSDFKNQM